MKDIKVKIDLLSAICLQRMIEGEIKNQEKWIEEDRKLGLDYSIRAKIVNGMKELSKSLEKQGVPKYLKS